MDTADLLVTKLELPVRENEDLTNLCRVCLTVTESMIYLLNGTDENNILLSRLLSIINVQDLDFGKKYPCYLCSSCEKKLNNSYEFVEQCKKAHNFICHYWGNHTALCSDENFSIKNEPYESKNSILKTSEDIIDQEQESMQTIMSNAIKMLNSKYNKYFVCSFCDLHVSSSSNLNVHIKEAHKESLLGWCLTCNESLQSAEHSNCRNKDFTCPYCQFQNSTYESALEHFYAHLGEEEKHLTNFSKAELHEEGNLCIKDEDNTYLSVEENEIISAKAEDTPKSKIYEKNKFLNRKKRLKQYNVEEVKNVVKLVRQRFFKNVNCIFCHFTAKSNRSLSSHITKLHREYKFKWCFKCNQIYDDLLLHKREVHSQDLTCPFCSRVHSNMGHFMDHLNSHSSDKLFKCNFCNKSFITTRHLKNHQTKHHPAQNLTCNKCDRKFSRKEALKIHKCSDLKRKETDILNTSIESSEDLSYLENDQMNLKKILQNYCNVCKKKIRSLEEHNLKFHSVPSLNVAARYSLCPYCGKQFKAEKINVHMRIHTGEAPYKCRYCDKRSKSRPALISHERTHTGERPYVCTVCGKGFAQSSSLNTHLKIHTGKPEQCKICEKRFCRTTELKLHMRIHTGEKPFSCNLCDQSFKQKSHLVEHARRHSDERPFQCNFCQKSFKNLSTLKAHLQIHTGEKPYKCTECSYACRQPFSLTQHMQQHGNDKFHMAEPRRCEICQRNFTTVAHLTAHYNRYHIEQLSKEQLVTTDVQFVANNVECTDEVTTTIDVKELSVDQPLNSLLFVEMTNEAK